MFAFFVVLMTWKLLITSLKDLMEATPSHVNVTDVCRQLRHVDGVISVHDLHVWGVATDKVMMTAHCRVADEANRNAIHGSISQIAASNGIGHSTVQLSEPAVVQC